MQTVAEYLAAIVAATALINQGRELTTDEYLEIGRLWNTGQYYNALATRAEVVQFVQLVDQQVVPVMVKALDMKVGRGYAFKSEALDFTLGGIFPAHNRYTIAELETP